MTTDTANTKPASNVWPVDRFITATAAIILLLLGYLIYIETAPFLLALYIVGAVMGVALFHGSFGFTGAWRTFVITGSAAGMRAQLIMFAAVTVLVVPLLAGVIEVEGVNGSSAPLGVSLLLGSFIFGYGMQLGGACGSGTLFTVGSGNTRMLITFLFFIVGAFVGSIHQVWWMSLPSSPAIVLYESLGPWLAITLQLTIIAALWYLFGLREKQKRGKTAWGLSTACDVKGVRRLFCGPWPLLWAALILALGNMLTVIISGSPWGITFAYALWGAKAAQAFGFDLASNAYWSSNFASLALSDSILVNVNSLMAIGVILGAMLAAGLANQFSKGSPSRMHWKSVVAAIIGGLLMGYGGRIGFGCNIGALFSGLASASLHAWVWFGFAFAGSWLGIKTRPLFGLENRFQEA